MMNQPLGTASSTSPSPKSHAGPLNKWFAPGESNAAIRSSEEEAMRLVSIVTSLPEGMDLSAPSFDEVLPSGDIWVCFVDWKSVQGAYRKHPPKDSTRLDRKILADHGSDKLNELVEIELTKFEKSTGKPTAYYAGGTYGSGKSVYTAALSKACPQARPTSADFFKKQIRSHYNLSSSVSASQLHAVSDAMVTKLLGLLHEKKESSFIFEVSYLKPKITASLKAGYKVHCSLRLIPTELSILRLLGRSADGKGPIIPFKQTFVAGKMQRKTLQGLLDFGSNEEYAKNLSVEIIVPNRDAKANIIADGPGLMSTKTFTDPHLGSVESEAIEKELTEIGVGDGIEDKTLDEVFSNPQLINASEANVIKSKLETQWGKYVLWKNTKLRDALDLASQGNSPTTASIRVLV